MKKAIVVVFVFLAGLSVDVFAETAGVPVSLDFPKGKGVISKDELIEKGIDPFYITGLTEFVFKKELESSTASNIELKGQWYLGKISLRLNDNLQPFVLLGSSEISLSADIDSTKIKSSGDGSFAYGGGFNLLLGKIPVHDIAFTISGMYRESKLDGKMREPASNVSNLESKIKEVELAVSASKDITLWNIPLRPYASLFYTDSDVNFSFNTNSWTVSYDLGAVDNLRNIGLALGCEKEFIKGLASAAEVRFFTELAATVGLTLKF